MDLGFAFNYCNLFQKKDLIMCGKLIFALFLVSALYSQRSSMRLSDFQFELPQDLIAQQPLSQRDASRMLILNSDKESWEDSMFRAFPDILLGNELIVVNNARVIPARLFGRRAGVRS